MCAQLFLCLALIIPTCSVFSYPIPGLGLRTQPGHTMPRPSGDEIVKVRALRNHHQDTEHEIQRDKQSSFTVSELVITREHLYVTPAVMWQLNVKYCKYVSAAQVLHMPCDLSIALNN